MKLFTFTAFALLSAASLDAQTVAIARAGSRPVQPGPTENFTGSVRVERLFDAVDPSHAGGGSVTFEPGARSAWHTHPRGQILIVTAGIGRVQGWGGPVEEIRTGDVVRIAAGQKHWHGASPQASMTHIAISEHRDGTAVEWMEKVTDEQYNGPVRSAQQPQPSNQLPALDAPPSHVAKEQMAAIAPKFVQLTSEIVFADLWRRSDLSVRDRSLVTIAALAAMGNDDQLDGYLRLGIESGLTRAQIVEAVTHLGFYAGWPKATKGIAAVATTLGRLPATK